MLYVIVCITVLAAINDDSATVPTLLTDYILNGQSVCIDWAPSRYIKPVFISYIKTFHNYCRVYGSVLTDSQINRQTMDCDAELAHSRQLFPVWGF